MRGEPRRARSSKFGCSARAGWARHRARAMVILYLRPSGRAPRNYPGWCRLAHQPGSLAHRLGVWGDKGSWHLWEGTETERNTHTSANTPIEPLYLVQHLYYHQRFYPIIIKSINDILTRITKESLYDQILRLQQTFTYISRCSKET